jgi:hypothetical protein
MSEKKSTKRTSQKHSSDPELEPGGRVHLIFHISAVVCSVAALIIGIIGLHVANKAIPPNSTPVRKLIELESLSVVNNDIDQILALYTPDAFIEDWQGEQDKRASGNSNGPKTIWSGLDEIRMRYLNLPKFVSLTHVGIIINFDNTKEMARATASTRGSYLDTETNAQIYISSNEGERWTFEKTGGKWLITSFTYNVP